MSQGLPVTSYALLGLLSFGDDLTGYELKQRADRTLRFYWVAPAMSQVYSELRRLTAAGLVEATGDAASTRYRISGQGRVELRDWMQGQPAGFPSLKHPVALKLLMSHMVEDSATIQMLEEYLTTLRANLADLREVRRSLVGRDAPGEAFHKPALVAEWGLAYYRSEQRIARRTLALLRQSFT